MKNPGPLWGQGEGEGAVLRKYDSSLGPSRLSVTSTHTHPSTQAIAKLSLLALLGAVCMALGLSTQAGPAPSVFVLPLGFTCVPTTSVWMYNILVPWFRADVLEPWRSNNPSSSLSLHQPRRHLHQPRDIYRHSSSSHPSTSQLWLVPPAILFLNHSYNGGHLLSTRCSLIHSFNEFLWSTHMCPTLFWC